MAPTSDEIEATALRARAEAEAAAIRGRAEVDALAVRAAADADAAAVRGQAELDAAATRRAADADRDEARRVLESARREAAQVRSEAVEVRRRTEQETLDRLLATRADLHDAIERLTEMAEPVLDLTDGGMQLAEAVAAADPHLVALDAVLEESVTEPVVPGTSGSESPADPVEALVQAAIGRAVDSASEPGRTQAFVTEQPARRREQMRDGRKVL